jgi:hypothetical protein
MDGNQDSI